MRRKKSKMIQLRRATKLWHPGNGPQYGIALAPETRNLSPARNLLRPVIFVS